MPDAIELLEISLADIDIPTDRARDLDATWAEALGSVIAAQGLTNPVTVRQAEGRYRLVTGLHRVEAFRVLGRDTIPARLSAAATDDEARLEEVMENLGRHELNALDRCHHLYELKQVWLKLHPESTHGGDRGNQHTGGKVQSLHFAIKGEEIFGFAEVTAEKIGLSRRTIFAAVAIWENLTPASRTRCTGTWMASKQSELKLLSAQKPPIQKKILDLILTDPPEADSVQGGSSGAVSYEEWCRYWDEQTSVAVLGETLSTNVKGQGSRAATETHAAVSDGVADADTDMLSTTLNDSLVRWIVEFNLPGARPPTVWRPRPKNEEAIERQKSTRADRQKKDLNNLFDLAAKGFRPARGIEDALTDIMGEDVVADDTLRGRFGRQRVAPDPAEEDDPEGGDDPPAFATGDDHDHGIRDMVDRLEAAAQPAIDGWLDMIRAEIARMVAAGEDMEALSARLLALSPELTVDPLGEIVAAGLTLADLTGRSQVQDEADADGE